MGNFRTIAKEIKEQIINRIKNEGVSVAQAAKDAGIATRTIYKWLENGIGSNNQTSENNKLKRENKFLLQLIGRLTMEKALAGGKK